VSDDDLEYLTQEEAQQIIERFMEIPRSYDRLVFWTGIPREWVQQWADDHSMLTFSSAMGPLMDSTDDRCLRRIKKRKQWKKYIKDACGIFARYACKRGVVRLLTLPPSWADFIRPESTYRNIEEPVLKGRSSCCCAVQIDTVHLLTTFEELEYQIWPENHIPDRLSCRDTSSFSFRPPSWTQDAVMAATKSLQSNVVCFTAFPLPNQLVLVFYCKDRSKGLTYHRQLDNRNMPISRKTLSPRYGLAPFVHCQWYPQRQHYFVGLHGSSIHFSNNDSPRL
jgi:hypothetical protein